MPPAAAPLARDDLVLGRYRPVRPLGSGGSGSVWLARDTVSGLDVALKIVPREGNAGSRAEREAEAAARLRHSRCLRAYALAHDSNHVYIVYEYVPGRTVREALRAGELTDERTIEAAAQICEGLAHAHARGVVHRDVKPANVLLAEGDGVTVKILDFGLAQMDEAETLTAMGDVPGTLAYIAPERLGGAAATPASDVWAVGVMLWEALGGGHPFWKPSLLESARAIEQGAPPLESVRPDLPKRLLAAVDRALSLDPARRPTAAALGEALKVSARQPRSAPARSLPLPRLVPVALAGTGAWLGASALPFFPHGWSVALAVLAAAAALARPWLGAAVALATPILPLGNLSLGLAIAYAAAAAIWLALFARESRWALLPALGPVLGPLAGLLPLAASGIRSPAHRVLAVAVGVVLTAPPALDRIGVLGSRDVDAAAGAFARSLDPGLPFVALVLGLAAAALPFARGPWAIAGWGTATLAAVLLLVPTTPALPLVLAVWATCAVQGRKLARAFGAALGVRGRTAQYGNTGPESTVRPAPSGSRAGGSAARSDAGQKREDWR